jgi:hypothetical protein
MRVIALFEAQVAAVRSPMLAVLVSARSEDCILTVVTASGLAARYVRALYPVVISIGESVA